MTDSTTGTAGPSTPLYEALLQFEDASNQVGVLTITTQGCYRVLTDAIAGYGNLSEAKVAFEFEAALLANAHEHWTSTVQAVRNAVADGIAWQQSFVIPRKYCASCGAQWTAADPWDHEKNCNSCFADARPDAPGGLMLSLHPDNVAHDEAIQNLDRDCDDQAARATFYGR